MCIGNPGGWAGLGENPGDLNSQMLNPQGWDSAIRKTYQVMSVQLEETLQSPLGSKEVKPVNPKENQPWIFIGKTEAEAPILWPPDVKS